MPRPTLCSQHTWLAHRAHDANWIASCQQCGDSKNVSACNHVWTDRPDPARGIVAYCAKCETAFPFAYEVQWGWITISDGEEEVDWRHCVDFVKANCLYLRVSSRFSWAKLLRVWPDGVWQMLKSGGPATKLDDMATARFIEAMQQRAFPERFFASPPAPLPSEVNATQVIPAVTDRADVQGGSLFQQVVRRRLEMAPSEHDDDDEGSWVIDTEQHPVPGSPAKVTLLAGRQTRQEELFHPGDPTDDYRFGANHEHRRNGRVIFGVVTLLCGGTFSQERS